MNIHFRLIGDVHGYPNIPSYIKRAKKAEYSLQVGDLCGGKYKFLNELDPDHHKVLAGNHEVYNKGSDWYFRKMPHFLGDFGVWSPPDFEEIFYLRGGFSLNYKKKQHWGCWSEEEELTVVQLQEAINLYAFLRPDFVVTHECPLRVVEHVTNPAVTLSFGYSNPIIRTKTNQALDAMMEIHQPKIWVFGHYHTYMSKKIDGTHFICLNQMPCKGHFLDFMEPELEIDEDLKDHLNPDDPFELDIGGQG